MSAQAEARSSANLAIRVPARHGHQRAGYLPLVSEARSIAASRTDEVTAPPHFADLHRLDVAAIANSEIMVAVCHGRATDWTLLL